MAGWSSTTRPSTSASSTPSSRALGRRADRAEPRASTPCRWRGASIPARRTASMRSARATASTIRRRTKHGALLDAEILAEVYIELIGGKQADLGLTVRPQRRGVGFQTGTAASRRDAAALIPVAPDAMPSGRPIEAFVQTLGAECALAVAYIVERRASVRPRQSSVDDPAVTPAAVCSVCSCADRALPIERDEIDRVDVERREAAVAHRVGHDLARERKEQPRAFDHDHRMQLVLRDVLNPENTRIGQLEGEEHLARRPWHCPRASGRPRNPSSASCLALTLT